MNKRQKSVIHNFIFVIVITIAAVLGMMNFKDYINRAEVMRGMTQLGQIILDHRQQQGAVPGQHYVDNIRDQLEGSARMGNIRYRGRWIGFGATDDEVLAYVQKNYKSIMGKGYVVLRLDGRVEWMKKKAFDELLDGQQSTYEKELATE